MFFFSFLLLSSSSAVVAADDAVFGVSGVCVCVCVCVCVVAVNAEVNNRRPVSGTSLTAPTPLDYLFIFFSISSFLSRKRTPVILADRPRRKNEKLGNKKKGCVFLFLFPRFCFVFFCFSVLFGLCARECGDVGVVDPVRCRSNCTTGSAGHCVSRCAVNGVGPLLPPPPPRPPPPSSSSCSSSSFSSLPRPSSTSSAVAEMMIVIDGR